MAELIDTNSIGTAYFISRISRSHMALPDKSCTAERGLSTHGLTKEVEGRPGYGPYVGTAHSKASYVER